MLKKILSISGKPGLFRLVSQGKNMLITENIATGQRTPAYASDKVVSLGDISIYTDDASDLPLYEVLEKVKEVNQGKAVDVKALGNDAKVREYFVTILPNFDQDRVYTSDIRKLLTWYNLLIAAGITDYKPEEEKPEATEAAPAEAKPEQPEAKPEKADTKHEKVETKAEEAPKPTKKSAKKSEK